MVLLVRYGELALKSRFVRRQLQDMLVTNIQAMFAAASQSCLLRSERGRIFVDADDERAAIGLLRRVFGVVSVSPAKATSSDLSELPSATVAYARSHLRSGMSFAIRPRRSGTHAFTSMELARVLGRAVQDAIPETTVNLDAPDVAIHVEVRDDRAYLFTEIEPGPGGLPLGSQGVVLGGMRDDAEMVAAWLIMRRGCRVVGVGSGEAVEALRRWDPRLETVAPSSGARLRVLAGEKGLPLVTAETEVEGVERDGHVFLLRPLVGLSPAEVAGLARSIRGG